MKSALIGIIIILLISCTARQPVEKTGRLKVVATTSLITEVVREIGGNQVEVEGLMGPGIDPHLYKASAGDVNTLFNADLVFYNGLHLEGKMQDIFESMQRQRKSIFAIADTISKDNLISSANFASSYDPHIWFDISNWKLAAAYIARRLSQADFEHKDEYYTNAKKYIKQLDSAEAMVRKKIAELPKEKRVLITAHDAFNYFGRAYDFEVLGLQGISTASEAGVQDVQQLTGIIVQRKIKAIFVESSVSLRNIEALREAVNSRGFTVTIGGSLYSDALGNPGTPEGTYSGMFLHNVNTVVNALK